MANTQAFNLVGRLGLNIAQFKTKLSTADKHLGSFKAQAKKATASIKKSFAGVSKSLGNLAGKLKLPGFLSIAGFALLQESSISAAKEIQNLANATGSSVREIQIASLAMKQLGLDTDDVGDTFNTLADRAKDAKDGMQSYIDDFRLVGIEVDDLKGKRPAELFELFADAIQKTEDPVKRSAAVVRILGDDLGRKLMPALMRGSEGFRQVGREADAAGIIMSAGTVAAAEAAGRSMGRLKSIIQAGTTKAFAQLGPVIDLVSTKLINFINSGNFIGDVFVPAVKHGAEVVGFLADVVHGLGVAWDAGVVAVNGAAVGFLKGFDTILKGAASFATGVKDFITLPLQGVLSLAAVFSDTAKEALAKLQGFKVPAPTFLDGPIQSQLQRLDTSVAALRAKLEEPMPSEGIKAFADEFIAVTAQFKESANAAEELRVNVAKAAVEGAEDLDNLKEKAEEVKSRLRDALGKGVASALEGDWKGIEGAFKSMLKRMVTDAITADLAQAFGLGAGTKGTSGTESGGTGAVVGALAQMFGGGFANGGNPPPGKVSLVGERGPEFIQPRHATTVTPMSGGGVTNIHMNISTPTPRSFNQSEGQVAGQLARLAARGRSRL